MSLLSTGCASHIGRTELLRQIEAGESPTIVDVRTRGEYESAHVPGAAHIPFYTLLSRADQIPPASREGDPIVVYCEHGPRAGMARAQLWLAVDRPVVYLEGHMIAWKREGLPVESGKPGG